MKHSHRPSRNRPGAFAKGPRNRPEKRHYRPERAADDAQRPNREERRFPKRDRDNEHRQHSSAEVRPQREERRFPKREHGGDRPQRSRNDDRKQPPEERRFPKRDRGGNRPHRNRDDRPDQPREERSFPRRDHDDNRRPHGANERGPNREERRFPKRRPDGDRPHRGGGEKSAFREDKPFPRRDRDGDRRHQKPYRDDKHFSRHDERPRQPEAPREGVLLWGVHAVAAAWLNPKRRCIRLWTTEAGLAAFEKIRTQAKDALLTRPDPKQVERFELDRLTPPGSVHQGIVLEAMPLHEPGLHEIITVEMPPDLVIALDQVTDPHNVGAIARSAAALGAGAMIMTERNAPGMTGVLAKAASGAIEHVPLIHIVNLARAIEELQQAGYWCVGLAEEGEKFLSACDLSGRTALILGSEGEGLRQLTRKKCDELAKLPTAGPIGSLNVSNAAAVALYEARRQKGKFG